MRSANLPIDKLRIILSGLLVGLVGCFVMIAMIMTNCDMALVSCITSIKEMNSIVSVFVGAGLSGMLFNKWFGQAGVTGCCWPVRGRSGRPSLARCYGYLV